MKNVKEVKIEVNGEKWQKMLDQAFNKKKKDIKIDGFRKGAVTFDMFVKKVGIESLFMDATDLAVNDAFKETLDKEKLELACEPQVNIESVDKNGVKFSFTFITRPEVKLGKYTKLGIKKDKVTVSKEEIDHEIEHLREHMAEVVVKENGKIVDGNIAIIDFDGIVDKKPLDGGSGKDYSLEIGSHTFIPGFEEGLIGLSVGEEKVLKLQFPEDYTPELKGKKVEFTVKVKEIKERILPEINKDFFEDLGMEDVKSLKDLEEHIKGEIEHHKSHEVDDKYTNDVLKKATENMTVELNPEIIDDEVERMIKEYSDQLKGQGLSFEQYLAMTGSKIEDVKTMLTPQAEARIKTRYLLEAIVKEEKISATEAEIEAEITKITESYGVDKDTILASLGGTDMIKYQVEMDKALEIVKGE